MPHTVLYRRVLWRQCCPCAPRGHAPVHRAGLPSGVPPRRVGHGKVQEDSTAGRADKDHDLRELRVRQREPVEHGPVCVDEGARPGLRREEDSPTPREVHTRHDEVPL